LGKSLDRKLFVVIISKAKDVQIAVKAQKCGKINPHLIKGARQGEILFPVFYFLIQHSVKRDKAFQKITDRFRNNFHGGGFKVNRT